mmetsp:Transcript_9747/g.15969  ORF Transcript_9747/g.15969 Transcript_9747/m.15969 type:complete len:194 (-) Transcript_9747:439-1020(-)
MIHSSQYEGRPQNFYRDGVLINNWNEDVYGKEIALRMEEAGPLSTFKESVSKLFHSYNGPAPPADLSRDLDGVSRPLMFGHGKERDAARPYYGTMNELTIHTNRPMKPQEAFLVTNAGARTSLMERRQKALEQEAEQPIFASMNNTQYAAPAAEGYLQDRHVTNFGTATLSFDAPHNRTALRGPVAFSRTPLK